MPSEENISTHAALFSFSEEMILHSLLRTNGGILRPHWHWCIRADFPKQADHAFEKWRWWTQTVRCEMNIVSTSSVLCMVLSGKQAWLMHLLDLLHLHGSFPTIGTALHEQTCALEAPQMAFSKGIHNTYASTIHVFSGNRKEDAWKCLELNGAI